jgi:hypothetical protein
MHGRMNSIVEKWGVRAAVTAMHRNYFIIRLKKSPLFNTSLINTCRFAGNLPSVTTFQYKRCLYDPCRYRYHLVSTDVPCSFSSTSDSHGTTEGNKPIDRADQIAQAAEALLIKDIGSFQYPSDFDVGHHLIKDLVHDVDSDSGCAQAINACIGLLERAVREYSILLELQNNDDAVLCHNTTSETDVLWFCNPALLNALLGAWRNHVIRQEKVVSPRDIFQKLKNMEKLLPTHFRFDVEAMNIILQAIVRQESPSEASIVVKGSLDLIKAESSSRASREGINIRPTTEEEEKMETVMEIIHGKNCSVDTAVESIDLVAYEICLRYWANLGHAGKVDAILAMIDQNERLQSKLDVNIIADAIFCYTKVGQMSKAEGMFDRMITIGVPSTNINPSDETKEIIMNAIKRGSYALLNYYRRAIVEAIGKQDNFGGYTHRIVGQNIERAEAVFERAKLFRDIDASPVGKLLQLCIFLMTRLLLMIINRRFFEPSFYPKYIDGYICTCKTA